MFMFISFLMMFLYSTLFGSDKTVLTAIGLTLLYYLSEILKLLKEKHGEL